MFNAYFNIQMNNLKIAEEQLAIAKVEKDYKVSGYQQLTECLKQCEKHLDDARAKKQKCAEEYTRMIELYESMQTTQIADPDVVSKSSMKLLYEKRMDIYMVFVESSQNVTRSEKIFYDCQKMNIDALDQYKKASKRVSECEIEVCAAKQNFNEICGQIIMSNFVNTI